MHTSSGPPLNLSILVVTIYCSCHPRTCTDKSSEAGREREVACREAPLGVES